MGIEDKTKELEKRVHALERISKALVIVLQKEGILLPEEIDAVLHGEDDSHDD